MEGTRKMKKEKPEGKTRYQMIIDGEIEPEGYEKGFANLKPIPITTRPPEERKAICSKGGKAAQRLQGERKTAKESLERMLSILATPEILEAADIETALRERLKRENPNMTIYDVVNAAAIGKAIGGSMQAAQYGRDTNGDKPKDEIQIESNIMTDADREMLQAIRQRMEAGERLEVVKDV